MRKIQVLLLIASLLLSSGCIGENLGLGNNDGPDGPIAPCTTKNLDENLVGAWTQHTFDDFTPKGVEYNADGTKVMSNTDPDFEGLEYCWTTENLNLISGYHWDAAEDERIDEDVDQITYSQYHVDGDLFFHRIHRKLWIHRSHSNPILHRIEKAFHLNVLKHLKNIAMINI